MYALSLLLTVDNYSERIIWETCHAKYLNRDISTLCLIRLRTETYMLFRSQTRIFQSSILLCLICLSLHDVKWTALKDEVNGLSCTCVSLIRIFQSLVFYSSLSADSSRVDKAERNKKSLH